MNFFELDEILKGNDKIILFVFVNLDWVDDDDVDIFVVKLFGLFLFICYNEIKVFFLEELVEIF